MLLPFPFPNTPHDNLRVLPFSLTLLYDNLKGAVWKAYGERCVSGTAPSHAGNS